MLTGPPSDFFRPPWGKPSVPSVMAHGAARPAICRIQPPRPSFGGIYWDDVINLKAYGPLPLLLLMLPLNSDNFKQGNPAVHALISIALAHPVR